MRFKGRLGKYRGVFIKSICSYDFIADDFVLYDSYDGVQILKHSHYAYWSGSVECKSIPEKVWRDFSDYVSSEFFEIDMRRVLGRNV